MPGIQRLCRFRKQDVDGRDKPGDDGSAMLEYSFPHVRRLQMIIDPNNRPGGGTLVVTAKSADKVQFFDAATLALVADLDMPGSTHELARSPDGATAYGSIYGGGIFGKNKDPDRRIAVLDLAGRTLARTIDLGAALAPHSGMMDARGTLWCTGELGECVFAVDPAGGTFSRIPVGGAAHWIAISHTANKLFASFKTTEAVAVLDLATHRVIERLPIPHGAEGVAVTPDGQTLFVCAHAKGAVHVFDTQSHAHRASLAIAGAPGAARQLRRVRVSPDGQYVCVSSHIDGFAAVYDAATLTQITGFKTAKAPMGFGFAADGRHAYLCCHDAAVMLEFELASGRVTRQVETAAGCEFVLAY
jgi:DNA-binding beta-propeller fold protein YncE